MKRRSTILTAALALLVTLAIPMGVWGQTKITDYSNIVSGNTYYIGATTGNTDYYLYVYHDDNSTSTAGTAKTSINDASTFVFEGSGTSWTVKFDNGKYLSLKDSKDNGKVQVVEEPATFTTSNQSGKIRLSKGNYSVQKNNSTTNFGSYANTQTDIWLMEVPSGLTLTTVTIDASGITNTDVHTSTTAGSLSATVTEIESGTAVSGATVTWSSSNENVATIASDGSVTLVAEGITTITASYAGVSGQYGESSATYDLTVSDSTPFAGGDVTFVAGTDLGTTSATGPDSMTKQVVTVSSTSAAFATAEYRLYSGSETTISTSFGTITQIEFTKNGNYSLGNLSTETGTYSFTTGIWTGDAQEVTFSAAAQVRLDQINVTITAPSSAIATTTTINVPSVFNTDIYQGTTAGTLTATVSAEGSPISGATVTWSSSNTGVATIDANGAVTLVAVGTTTITANYAGVEDEYRPSTGTYELTVTDSNAPGTENNPYTVAQAIAATPSNGNVYIQGIVSSFYNTSIVGDGNNFRYYISDDGTTTTQLLVYKGKGLNEATFTNADDLLVGDEVVICGTLITYQNAPEVASGNYLYSWNRPSTPSQEYTLTVTASENVEIFTFVGESTDPGVEGSTTLQVYNGTEVGLSVSATTGYILTLKVDGTDVTSQLDESGYYTFNMPNHDVTVTATAVEFVPSTGDEYTLYTGELVEGDYLIVFDDGAMNTTVTNDRLQYEDVTANNDVIVTDNAAIVWHIAPSGQYWTIYNADADAYAASTGAKNKAQMLANGTDDKALWTVSGTETYEFVNKKNTANNVNANLRKNGTFGFACYATSTGGALSLYKKVENTPAEYTLTINGYQSDENPGGYYLIASPVTVDLTDHEMTTGDFDLYYFDQAQDKEWINYEGENGNFNLEPGKGYLYAHKTGGNFTLTGTAYDGEGEIELVYDNNAVDFKGWNLVGNPWGVKAYPDHEFYTMAEGGASIDVTPNVAGTEVAPMTGIFVVAEAANETVTFSTENPNGKSANLALNITNSSKLVDRAIVRFGEGRQLPKFQLRDNSTKIYFEQSNKDYAIVNAEEIGEMPVSFKAENNGTYTFSVNTENVEMEYLHLIDNMTGADIDLIANPSYSFEAKVTDYASRFRLVFSANSSVNEQNANNFAFFNGNDWTINNEGEATLQVVDMTGRVLSTETVNGNATTKVNAATGVYMLRLINGNNIKTQKVVVK